MPYNSGLVNFVPLLVSYKNTFLDLNVSEQSSHHLFQALNFLG